MFIHSDGKLYFAKGIETKEEEQMSKITMTKRFYSSKSGIQYPPILKTLGEAIKDASTRCENGEDIYYVVEVVRVVRRANPVPPIIVEEVRKDA